MFTWSSSSDLQPVNVVLYYLFKSLLLHFIIPLNQDSIVGYYTTLMLSMFPKSNSQIIFVLSQPNNKVFQCLLGCKKSMTTIFFIFLTTPIPTLPQGHHHVILPHAPPPTLQFSSSYIYKLPSPTKFDPATVRNVFCLDTDEISVSTLFNTLQSIITYTP